MIDALKALRMIFAAAVLAPSVEPAPAPTMEERSLFEGLHISAWRVTAAKALARYHGALAWVQPHGLERTIRVFGPADAVAAVAAGFAFVSEQVAEEMARARVRGKTAHQSFAQGLAAGLAADLANPKPGAMAEEELLRALGRPLPEVRAPRTRPATRPYQAGLRRAPSVRPPMP